ncbi:MAG: hypothetical protein PGN07_01925 [Aeromicrobium erythreum]
MSAIAHYVHVHLAGSAAGIDLFTRSGEGQLDGRIARMVLDIRDELVDERARLQRMADALDVGESTVLTTAARVGERIGRLKPNESLVHRTPLTDLVELEAMRDAVAGKIAGWQALLTVVDVRPELDRGELDFLLAQGLEQHDRLTAAHRDVAGRVLAP